MPKPKVKRPPVVKPKPDSSSASALARITPAAPALAQDREPNSRSLSSRDLVRQTRTFFDVIGKDGVIHMLTVLGPDTGPDVPESKESRLIALLQDPQYENDPLHLLARRAGISLSSLKELFVSYQMTEGVLRAYQHLPKIMEDTAVAATEREVTCSVCRGAKVVIEDSGEDAATVPCRRCAATGLELLYPEPAARALMFETTGLTKKGGGITIQQNNTNVNVPGASSFEDLMRESSKVIDVTPRKEERS